MEATMPNTDQIRKMLRQAEGTARRLLMGSDAHSRTQAHRAAILLGEASQKLDEGGASEADRDLRLASIDRDICFAAGILTACGSDMFWILDGAQASAPAQLKLALVEGQS
jgi:hypothetical protein